MQVTFRITSHEFTFEDNYFVQAAFVSCSPERKHRFVACFADLAEAISFADRLVERSGIESAWVFSRDAQVHSAYANH